MNKKLIISLSIIGVVATAAIGGTIAYLNDTETSTGNIFVAGTLDLRVDHNKAYYNGMSCENGIWQCDPWTDYVVSFDQGVRKNGTPVLAERSDPTQALGAAQNNDTVNFVSLGFSTGIDGYIVLGFYNKIINGAGNDIKIYETSYGNPPDANYPEKAEVFASQDGSIWTSLGIVTLDEELDLGSLSWAKYLKFQDMTDKNDSHFPGDADGYDIDGVKALYCESDPDLTGQACNGSWSLTDITNQQFYSFADVKPGDSGKNSISFHVYNNDGWACLSLENKQDNENTCIDPEVGDTTCGTGNTEGELSQYMNAFVWRDDGDALYEPLQGETEIFNSFFQGGVISVADASTGGPLVASNTKWIGLMWCAGTVNVTNWGGLTCDGSTMGDTAQTDGLIADVIAYTEQWRNNPNFYCNPQP